MKFIRYLDSNQDDLVFWVAILCAFVALVVV